MPCPSTGAGQTRSNGFEVSRQNSSKPAAVAPRMAITLACRVEGRWRPNQATAPPQAPRISAQSRIEPSWFPQMPVIL